MNVSTKRITKILAVVFVLSAAGVGTAAAQDKAAAPKKGESVITPILENDKVKVYSAVLKPGDVSPMRERNRLAIHFENAGKQQRTYADGKIEDRVVKAGDTIWVESATYAVKNTGKTTMHIFVVQVK